MTKDNKFTMKEVKEGLTLAIGEAFARLAKAKSNADAKKPAVRAVAIWEWLGEGDSMIPDSLAYNTSEDFMFAGITDKGYYELTYVATDGLTFSVADKNYFGLIHDFVDYFFRIYKA